MPRRVEDLASRVEELEGEYERLLDEYVEVRQRLDYVESFVETRASGTHSEAEASPEDIDEAIQEVAEESEGNEVKTPGQDDIIIA